MSLVEEEKSLLEIGKVYGHSGEELRSYVDSRLSQLKEREDRAIERERRKRWCRR